MSWSMVALLVSLAGALLIGLIAWVPPLLGKDSGVQPIQPGLLTVAPDVAGVITLGGGRAVALDPTGLRITNGDDILYRTVRGGSPLTALRGSVDEEERREDVEERLPNLTVDDVVVSGGTARYAGHLAGDGADVPVTIAVTFDDEWVRMLVEAAGVDALVVHGYEEPATLGVEPALPGRDLRRRALWIPSGIGRATPVLVSELGAPVALGPGGTVRAVDLRLPGHIDLHVWSDVADLSVTSWARYKGTS